MIFDVNKDLNSLLETIPELNRKVFPIVAENSTTFPFAVYQRTNTDFNTVSKDNNTFIHTFEVSVVTDNYSKGADVANRVFELLNNKTVSSKNIDWITVDNVTESYSDGAFIYLFSIVLTKRIQY